jgi:hypothetical protein
MKKYVAYCILLFVAIGFQACLFQEDEFFDESSANRATGSVLECQEILKGSPNGWRMEYYAGADYSYGGIVFFMKFGENKVDIACEIAVDDNYVPGESVSSLYKVESEQSTMLVFDSYNSLLHAFAAPLGYNANLEGDYEFVIMEVSPEKIILQGKKYKNIMEMIPMAVDEPWKVYLDNMKKIRKDAFLNTYRMEKDGNVLKTLNKEAGTLNTFLAYEGTADDAMLNGKKDMLPFLYTDSGLKLQSPYKVAGVEVQHFKWESQSRKFICTDQGATDIYLKEFYPDGYLQYNDYAGEYMMAIVDYEGQQNLLAITIAPKVQGETYDMKGFYDYYGNEMPFVLQYDKATGKILLNSQVLGRNSFGYYLGCAAGIIGYAHSELVVVPSLRSGLVGVVSSTNPLVFYFADSQMQENTSLLVWAYTSDKYTEASLAGYWEWYDLLALTKEDSTN